MSTEQPLPKGSVGWAHYFSVDVLNKSNRVVVDRKTRPGTGPGRDLQIWAVHSGDNTYTVRSSETYVSCNCRHGLNTAEPVCAHVAAVLASLRDDRPSSYIERWEREGTRPTEDLSGFKIRFEINEREREN